MSLRRRFLVSALIGAAALTGCSSSKSTTSSHGAAVAGDVTIHIKNFAFGPTPVTMHAGHKVTFINDDDSVHTATVASGAPGPYDSGNLSKGQSSSFTPMTAGTYNYYCAIHQYMKGSLVVTQ